MRSWYNSSIDIEELWDSADIDSYKEWITMIITEKKIRAPGMTGNPAICNAWQT